MSTNGEWLAYRVARVTLLTAAVLATSSARMLGTARERNWRSIIRWPAMSNGVAAEADDPGVSFRASHPERTFRAVVGIEVRDAPYMAGGPLRALRPTKTHAVPWRAMTDAPYLA